MRNPYSGNVRIGPRPTQPSVAGQALEPVYEPFFDGSHTTLRKVGERNVFDYVQSFKDSTDLAYMLHRLSVGDTSVLSSRQPLYGDFSTLPSSPGEMFNFMESFKRAFDDLPSSEKGLYNNDWRIWANHCACPVDFSRDAVTANSDTSSSGGDVT